MYRARAHEQQIKIYKKFNMPNLVRLNKNIVFFSLLLLLLLNIFFFHNSLAPKCVVWPMPKVMIICALSSISIMNSTDTIYKTHNTYKVTIHKNSNGLFNDVRISIENVDTKEKKKWMNKNIIKKIKLRKRTERICMA